jgi:hypothetical protein
MRLLRAEVTPPPAAPGAAAVLMLLLVWTTAGEPGYLEMIRPSLKAGTGGGTGDTAASGSAVSAASGTLGCVLSPSACAPSAGVLVLPPSATAVVVAALLLLL